MSIEEPNSGHEQATQRLPAPGRAQQPNAQDELATEIMGVESPEGPPPLRPDRKRSSVALICAAAVVVIGSIGLLAFGGVASFGLGIVLAAVLLGAGFPVWASALLRRGERHHAEEEASTIRGWFGGQR